MSQSDEQSRVIGFFAVCDGQMLLDGDACVVVGSNSSMTAFLATQNPVNPLGEAVQFRAKKIRFGAIHSGLEGGGAYAFDREAYERFYPVANNHGYTLDPDQFNEAVIAKQTFDEKADGALSLLTLRRQQ